MQILVSYDVSTDTSAGRRRLRKVALVCKDFGQRVQKSVFECSLNEIHYERLLRRLLECIDQKEDSLRIYRIRGPKEESVIHYGHTKSVDFNGPLIF